MTVAVILYEDSRPRGPAARQFALHQLVLSCVGDRVGKSGWELKDHFEANPCRGASKLRGTLERGAVGSRGERVIPVFDRDKIHHVYDLSAGCKAETCAAIRATAAKEIRGRLVPVLIEDNLETIVDACCDAVGKPRPLGKPKPAERDRLIAKPMGDKAHRDAVLKSVPSLGYLVEKLAQLIVEAEPL